jgi:hypothetical protein
MINVVIIDITIDNINNGYNGECITMGNDGWLLGFAQPCV